MKNLLIALVVIVMTGCANLASVDHCRYFETQLQQSYCYASEEVKSAYNITAQSLRDGAITVEQAEHAREKLRQADAALNTAYIAIDAGNDDQANAQIVLLRKILLEIKQR